MEELHFSSFTITKWTNYIVSPSRTFSSRIHSWAYRAVICFSEWRGIHHYPIHSGTRNTIWAYVNTVCSLHCYTRSFLHITANWVRALFCVLDLCTRWEYVVSVAPWAHFSPWEWIPSTHWIGGWVGLRAGLDTKARGKILWLCRGLNPGHSRCSQDTKLTELPQCLPLVCSYVISLQLLTFQEMVYGSPFLPEEYNLLVTKLSSMSGKWLDWVR
jgi:hypothetical protein